MIIEGTTLEFISKLPDDMCRCRCITCGTEDTYKFSYIKSKGQECRTCKRYKNPGNLINNGIKNKIEVLVREEINRIKGAPPLREGSDYIETKKTFKRIPLGKFYGDYKVFGYCGKYGPNGARKRYEKVVLRCDRCGNFKEVSIRDIDDSSKFYCGVCSKIRKEAETRVNDAMAEIKNKEIQSAQKAQELIRKKQEEKEQRELDKLNRQLEKEQKKRTDELLREQQKREKIANKENAKLQEYKRLISEKNPGYFVKVKPENPGFITTLICKECGTVISFTNTNRNKVYECEGCKKKKENPFYKGTYTKDYINSVFNGLRIVNQYKDDEGFKCDAVCRYCGEEFNNIDLFDVINRKIYCECKYSCVDVFCDKCGTPISITKKELSTLGDNGITCKCGEQILKSTIENEVVIEDTSQTMRDKAKAIGEKFKSNNVDIKPDIKLIKEREPLYAGTDGEYYYRCTCIDHNVTLILNNTEIENYDHTQCNDIRQHLLAKPESDKIKM